jgi:hypothetical protein
MKLNDFVAAANATVDKEFRRQEIAAAICMMIITKNGAFEEDVKKKLGPLVPPLERSLKTVLNQGSFHDEAGFSEDSVFVEDISFPKPEIHWGPETLFSELSAVKPELDLKTVDKQFLEGMERVVYGEGQKDDAEIRIIVLHPDDTGGGDDTQEVLVVTVRLDGCVRVKPFGKMDIPSHYSEIGVPLIDGDQDGTPRTTALDIVKLHIAPLVARRSIALQHTAG